MVGDFFAPAVPAGRAAAGEELDFGLVGEHPLDAVADLARFLGVPPAGRADQLANVAAAARLGNATTFEDEAELALRERVVAGVDALLVPDEGDGGPSEAPGFAELDRLIEMRRSGPEEEHAVVGCDLQHRQLCEVPAGDGGKVPHRAAAVAAAGPGVLQLALVVPGRVGVDHGVAPLRERRELSQHVGSGRQSRSGPSSWQAPGVSCILSSVRLSWGAIRWSSQ